MLQQYLKKNSFRDQKIEESPQDTLGIIVVIPAHDERSLLPTLKSLQNCKPPKSSVEVIIVFNASEKSAFIYLETNEYALEEAKNWYNNLDQQNFILHLIEENTLPQKHAGVGLARKIGMDEAIRRFATINRKDGVIACFDADSKCKENYLTEIENHFERHPKTGACSIHFEHPVEGNEFTKEVYRGIYFYELHLRYYKNGLAYAGLPYAFHTIGSSMAVRAEQYCKQGGMNRRKAGEDFYFLQKFIDVGVLSELNTTAVIPSPRASHRVPFGTGRAIQEMIDNEREIEKSYAFECFKVLKDSFSDLEDWYTSASNFNSYFLEFCGEKFLKEKLEEIRVQSTDIERFKKRFFQWFNAFQALKFIHFLREHHFKNELLTTEVEKLLELTQQVRKESNLLLELRKLDRKERV